MLSGRRESMDKVVDQIPSVATSLAGLILVFLGVVFTTWESYDTTAKKSVTRKFRVRAWLAFLGFLFAAVSTVAALIGIGIDHTPRCADYCAIGSLALSGAFMFVIALLVVLEI